MGSISGLRSVKEGGCLRLINGYNIYTLTINQGGGCGGVPKKHGRLLYFTIQACIMARVYIIKPLSRGGYE